MHTVRSVLLVHNEPEAFSGLERTLRDQGIQASRARQCAEAREVLRDSGPVDLVLTDVTLADGTWKDVIQLARQEIKETPVVVMSRVVDMRTYLDTQDAGAADFIVPPMTARDLAHTLTTAMERTLPAWIGAAAPVRGRRNQRTQPPAH